MSEMPAPSLPPPGDQGNRNGTTSGNAPSQSSEHGERSSTAEPPPINLDERDVDRRRRISAALQDAVDDPSLVFDRRFLNDVLALSERDRQRVKTAIRDLDVTLRDWDKALSQRRRDLARAEKETTTSERKVRTFAERLVVDGSAIFQKVWEDDRERLEMLATFGAKIVEEEILDDGVESELWYVVECTVAGETQRLRVSAPDFPGLRWVAQLGARAVLAPGRAVPDCVRAAIMSKSTPSRRTVYRHLGWRQLPCGSIWYLHAGGSIGVDVVAESARASSGSDERKQQSRQTPMASLLPTELALYTLPDPVTGEPLVSEILASLRLLDLGPRAVMFALLSLVYRALLGAVDFGTMLFGGSGAFKSEVAALIQQHWGAGMVRKRVPLHFVATANAIEVVLFHAKDTICVIDDYLLSGSSADRQRQEATLDRLARAVGNGATRSRMAADGTLRPPRPPRASILITGEHLPSGHSCRSRLLILEITKGEIQAERLTRCQNDAAAGAYSRTLASFLSWMARRKVAGSAPQVGTRAQQLRAVAASTTTHRRTPGVAADLGVGLELFLEFALEAGALSPEQRDDLWREGWDALVGLSARQADYQTDEEPAQKFLRLFSSALSTGTLHLCSMTGGQPLNARRWGWKEISLGDKVELRAGGDQVGWVDGANVYLEPDAAYTAVQRFATDGHRLAVDPVTLRKRLFEAGFLASVDERGGATRHLVRRVVQGRRQAVLHIRLPDEPPESGGSAQPTSGAVTESTERRPQKTLDLFQAEASAPRDGLRHRHGCG